MGDSVTDPYDELLLVSLGWHQDEGAPWISGTIEVLLETSGRYVGTGESRVLGPESVLHTPVTSATHQPVGPLGPGGREILGVVVGIRVDKLRLPTPEQVAARIRKEDHNRRTLVLEGPVAAFGSTPIVEGATIRIDLDHAGLTKLGGEVARRTGSVSGEVLYCRAKDPRPDSARLHVEPDWVGDPPDQLVVHLLVDKDHDI